MAIYPRQTCGSISENIAGSISAPSKRGIPSVHIDYVIALDDAALRCVVMVVDSHNFGW